MEYFLRTDTEQEMVAALVTAGILTEVTDSQNITIKHKEVVFPYTLVMVGTVRRDTGARVSVVSGDEEFEEPVLETLPGYHANLLGELTPEQIDALPIIPEPDDPACRFWR